MKYTCKIILNKTRAEVIDAFDSIENMYKWQKGLISFEILEGQRGINGLKSKLTYDMNGKIVEMIETIEGFSFPNQMIAIYEAKNVWNRCVNTFVEKEGQTIWSMESEFQFKGIMFILSKLMKKSFIKETQSSMEDFKSFLESL